MTQWHTLLKSLGFTDSESKIYLLSLEMGPAAVQDIAKRAGVSRVTTYAVIESLMKDGLMSTVQKGKKHLYVAESPDRLVAHMQSKMEQMKATLKELDQSVDELRLLTRGEKPVVKMFEGIEGTRAIMQALIDSKAEKADVIYDFANVETSDAGTPEEERRAMQEYTIKNDLHVVGVFRTEKSDYTSNKNVKLYLLPKHFNFPGEILAMGNKIALISYTGKRLAVLIESPDLAQTVREMFRVITTNPALTEK
ncbi:MAG: helix-turn-helix domain-containing protein [bacterium]|nr:helix-turn-helix domain-containing protein [bacterium]